MDEIFRYVVQFLHVFSGILWIGGGLYTLFVQTPALLAAPPQARGPVLGQIVPRQVNYLLRLGEVTIALGILNVFASGKARLLQEALGSRWSLAIIVGGILAIVLLAIGHGVLKPSATRLLELGPRAAGPIERSVVEKHLRAGRINGNVKSASVTCLAAQVKLSRLHPSSQR